MRRQGRWPQIADPCMGVTPADPLRASYPTTSIGFLQLKGLPLGARIDERGGEGRARSGADVLLPRGACLSSADDTGR